MSAIVHEYYKLEQEDFNILLQIDPIHWKGLELIVFKNGKIEKNFRDLDETIYEDLNADGFQRTGALEFNLYLKGLGK